MVRDAESIVPFAQELVSARIDHLESNSAISLPKVTDLPKLIKSHNLALKDGDDILSWYARLNDFCMMLGIYICPPNSMDKNSEMGKEWDSKCLPFAFYDKFPQSERILSHILRSPGFLPDKYKDELLLNPKPYNFLRLFIALHACSGSDLSTMVVHHPGAMKISQSLVSYAYSWVKYFTNEANINGIPYSKYWQSYAYFVDGLHHKYAPIKKFLEQDFQSHHDRHNNIPISLELHNLPATIASLATIHGISISSQNGQVQQVKVPDNNTPIDNEDPKSPMIDDVLSSIQQIHQFSNQDSVHKGKSTNVQCWLCDGPHTFRACDQLKRLHSVCAKRPTLSKYISSMVKHDKNDSTRRASIKAIITALDVIDSEPNLPLGDSPPQQDNSIQAIIDAALGSTSLDENDERSQLPHDVADDKLNSVKAVTFSTDNDCYIEHDSLFFSLSEDDENFHDDVIRAIIDDDTDNLVTNSSCTNLCDELCISSVLLDKICEVKLDVSYRAQVDSAADRTTTPHRELIHDFRLPDPSNGDRTSIGDAGIHSHRIMGYGFFHVKAYKLDTNEEIILRAPCMYIPSIPSTLMNFLDIPNCMVAGELVDKCNHTAYRLAELEDSSGSVVRCKVPLVCVNTRLYTAEHLILSSPSEQTIRYDIGGSVIQRIVSDEPTRLLWHSHFGHLNFRCLSSLHRTVIGLPKIKDAHTTDNCPECLESKLKRSPHGHGSMIEKATSTGQIMSADWGFMCLHSENESRVQRLRSYYGDTSYIIFTCAYSGALFGACGPSRAVPFRMVGHVFLPDVP